MRKITIHQGSSIIEVFDDDNSDIDTYCNDLSKVFDANNISLLKTSQSTVILRPSKINGIVVETQSPPDEIKEVVQEDAKEEKTEDIIMDMD